MWKVLNIEVVLGEPTSFFDHLYLGVYSRTRWHKQRYCWQLQNHVWIQNFSRKASMIGKSVYFFVVLWHGRPCQEMCGTILWVGKQDDSTTLQSIISVHWRPSFQRRRVEIRGRIVKSMLSISSEMLRLGTYWRDLIFYGLWTNLHDQSQKKTKACDKRLSRLFSYIHHTCDYKQYCHVGNTAKQCRLGLFQDSDFAGDLEDFKIYIRWNIMRFWKSYICSNQLDVNNFFWCRFTHGRYSRSHSLGFGDWNISFQSSGETRCRLPSQTCIIPSKSSIPTSFQLTLTTFHPNQAYFEWRKKLGHINAPCEVDPASEIISDTEHSQTKRLWGRCDRQKSAGFIRDVREARWLVSMGICERALSWSCCTLLPVEQQYSLMLTTNLFAKRSVSNPGTAPFQQGGKWRAPCCARHSNGCSENETDSHRLKSPANLAVRATRVRCLPNRFVQKHATIEFIKGMSFVFCAAWSISIHWAMQS